MSAASKAVQLPAQEVLRFLLPRLLSLFPGTTEAALARLFFWTRAPWQRAERSAAPLEWITAGGGKPGEGMRIQIEGEGPGILLLHGWGGHVRQLDELKAALQDKGFRVLLPHLPGHGASPGHTCSLPRVTELLLELDRRHGPFHGVLAHSFGALCLSEAHKRGFRTRAQVLVAPAHSVEFFLESWRTALGLPRECMPGLRRRILRIVDDPGFDWENLELRVPDAMKAHSLLIHDLEDRIIPADLSLHLAERQQLPGTRFSRGLGHGRILRDAETVKAAAGFLESAGRLREGASL